MLMQAKCHQYWEGLTGFVCTWRGIIYLVGGFDCPQYLIYICASKLCSAVEIQNNAAEIHRKFRAGAISLQIPLSVGQNFEMVHADVPFIPQSSPGVHISCRNWRRVGILAKFLGKSPWKDICIFITRGGSPLETLECYASKIHQFISDSGGHEETYS